MARANLLTLIGLDPQSVFKTALTEVSLLADSSLKGKRQSIWGLNWSAKLSSEVLSKFAAHPSWLDSHPILTGSWSENLLSPQSDLDVVFLGKEHVVKSLMKDMMAEGFPLRGRVVMNPADLRQGGDWRDHWALLSARPLTDKGQMLLQEQIKSWKQKKNVKPLLKSAIQDRQSRQDSYNSLQFFLEPNIKHCSGGVRDLRQALQIYKFEPLFEQNYPELSKTFDQFLKFYFNVRWLNHCLQVGDQLVAQSQLEIYPLLGFSSLQDFMQALNQGFQRVGFYGDWMLWSLLQPDFQKLLHPKQVIFDPLKAFNAFQKKPDIGTQFRVRRGLDAWPKLKQKQQGELLKKALSLKTKPQTLIALFRSRWMDRVMPELKPLVGYVQHDQYHRFTADTHLLRACLEAHEIWQHRQRPAYLKKLVRDLSPADFQIILWSAFFHDLAKGRKGDHSELIESWLKKWMRVWKWKSAEELRWLVANHLLLSDAAFRKSLDSQETWKNLFSKGLNLPRLRRLALWTAIDIRATNPEAWNSWKESLIQSMVKEMENPLSEEYLRWIAEMDSRGMENPQDSFPKELFRSLGGKSLSQDLELVRSLKVENYKVLVVKAKTDEVWIRFFHPKDRTGLLKQVLSRFYSLGVSVEEAYLQSLSDKQVYDWFRVRSRLKLDVLSRLLAAEKAEELQVPHVEFTQIDLVESTEKETRISFRGKDQKGLLLAAAHFFSEQNISIKSAKVHTWGGSIEDVFSLNYAEDPETLLKKAQEFFISPRG